MSSLCIDCMFSKEVKRLDIYNGRTRINLKFVVKHNENSSMKKEFVAEYSSSVSISHIHYVWVIPHCLKSSCGSDHLDDFG